MKKLIMLFLAGLFSAGAAMANENFDFSKLDQDGDGQLSRTEVAQNAELAAQFSTVDANGDGYLDQQEAKSAKSQDKQKQKQGMGQDY